MSQKRQQEDATNANSSDDSGGGGGSGGTSNSFDKRRKLPKFKSVVHEVINMCRVKNYMEPVLEPLIRKVVREEVELAFRKYLISMKRNCGKDAQISETRNLQLQFQTRISLPVFTGAKIEGEYNNNNSNLKLELIDSITGQIISNGIESSAKVEIVVLEGDFDNEEGENWTIEEFKNNIVKEREGKKSLLSGDLFVILKDGIGIINDISFTDNSSWTRSRKFRLGARIVENWNGIKVKEAKTESFIVRDHRGECKFLYLRNGPWIFTYCCSFSVYKKHHPPSLTDEVWRLEKIGKDGAFHKRLSKERVFTVKDFLILLFLDPTRLRNILGTGMSAKMWETVIDHAQTCVLDYKAYVYYTSASQQKIGVVFNVVGQVIGLLSDDRYIASDKMSETEKDDARNLVISAFRHSDEVISFDDEATFLDSFSRLSTTQYSPNLPIPMCGPGSSSGKTPEMSVVSPNMIYSVAGLDDYMDPMDVRFDPSLNFTSFSYEQDFLNNDMFEDNFDPFSIPSTSMEAASGNMYVGPTTVVTPDKAQRRWKMLFSVLRWFSIRRIVATKRTRVEAIQGGY